MELYVLFFICPLFSWIGVQISNINKFYDVIYMYLLTF